MDNQWIYALAGIGIAAIALLTFFVMYQPVVPSRPNDLHFHADFKVFLNGVPIDFSQSRFQSDENQSLSPSIHLHGGNGNVIHKHQSRVTLGDFFESIGMKLSSTCILLIDKTTYCNSGENTLKMFVNGKPSNEFDRYDFQDLDRILISYGNDSSDVIANQLSQVTDNACIQSGTCPERGAPFDESDCTTANGCMATGPMVIE